MQQTMSVRGAPRTALPALLLGCGLVVAEPSEAPEIEFIEYLGMWDESDDEWLMFEATDAQVTAGTEEERIDPVPEGEESKELDDEG